VIKINKWNLDIHIGDSTKEEIDDFLNAF